MASYWSRAVASVRAAATAAKETWQQASHETEAAFSDVENRQERYELYWNFYVNNLYRQMNTYRSVRGLYRHIRPIYNPVTRLVDFYVAKVWGGQLDYETVGGAIPIKTDNDRLREPIAQIWEWSNWQARKQLAIRYGACLGDLVIKVVDDERRKQVYLQVMHPRMIKAARFDARGYVTEAVIEYEDWEPSTTSGVYQPFTYKEVITKEQFRTFKDSQAHDYYGSGAEWDNPYEFVPMVISPHKDIGLDWGLCCFHNGLDTIDELNDQASVFNDRMRKANSPVIYFAGARAGSIDMSSTDTATDESRRQQSPALYGPAESRPHFLVSEAGMEQSLANVDKMLDELERDFPELALHRLREGGDLSGKALRIMYQDATDRVVEARGNFDAALVRAHQMAVSIGGMRGLFDGFSLDSYQRGDEDHRIGERPVLAEAIDFGQIDAALRAGVPAWRLWSRLGLGFSQEEIEEMRDEAYGGEELGAPWVGDQESDGEDG